MNPQHDPLEVTNRLLQAILLVMVMGPPPPEGRDAFLASVGLRMAKEPEPTPADSGIVQFPDRSRSPRTPEAG